LTRLSHSEANGNNLSASTGVAPRPETNLFPIDMESPFFRKTCFVESGVAANRVTEFNEIALDKNCNRFRFASYRIRAD
jgi:hypothetical protein